MMMLVAPLFAMATPPDGGSIVAQLIPLALVLAIFYFVILLPTRRKQQKVEQFQSALKVGDRIITTSGIYGKITRMADQSAQIEIAPNVRIEVAKAAIGGYQGQAPVVDAANS
jgi:preprotein translocase subunit YajC